MSYGYSFRLIQLNHNADDDLLGVRLGRLCIRFNVPVSAVAEKCGVSRPTVYNWFSGETSPLPANVPQVEAMIAELQQISY